METRKRLLAATAICLSAAAAVAEDSAITLGESAFGALCAVCHGESARGGGEIAELFEVRPPKLTDLAQQAGGTFPFANVYEVVILGMEAPGHGSSQMPVWGDYFMADAMKDRGVSTTDSMYMAAGRAMSIALYLESIQE